MDAQDNDSRPFRIESTDGKLVVSTKFVRSWNDAIDLAHITLQLANDTGRTLRVTEVETGDEEYVVYDP